MNTPEDWSPEEQRLHDALHRAAGQVDPGPDGLARIRRRTAHVPAWRSPVMLGLAGATALAAAVIVGGVVVVGGSDDDPIATSGSASPNTGEPTTPSTTSPSTVVPPPDATTPGDDPSTGDDPSPSAPAQALTVPVYYVAGTGAGERLTREFHSVQTTSPPIKAAVEELMAPALDPDYASLWQPGVEVLAADITGEAIVVDLGAAPSLDDPSAERSELAVQQLIYTATAAAAMAGSDGSLPVRVTVDGEPAGALFGDQDLSEPVERADPLEARQLVQIDNPTHGASLTSPVVIDGVGAAFEATLEWRVLQDGEVVDSGSTMAEECCTFSPFEFSVELEPGTYEVVVSESDPSGGEGRPAMSDTKTFTVE